MTMDAVAKEARGAGRHMTMDRVMTYLDAGRGSPDAPGEGWEWLLARACADSGVLFAECYSKQDVATLLGVSVPTVNRLVRTGDIRATRVSRRLTYFEARDLETFLRRVDRMKARVREALEEAEALQWQWDEAVEQDRQWADGAVEYEEVQEAHRYAAELSDELHRLLPSVPRLAS